MSAFVIDTNLTHKMNQPIKKSQKTRGLCFQDGQKVKADGGHLWFTNTHADRKNKSRSQDKTIKYSELKDVVAESIIAEMADFQARRAKIDDKEVSKVIAKGQKQAQEIENEANKAE